MNALTLLVYETRTALSGDGNILNFHTRKNAFAFFATGHSEPAKNL